MVPPSGTEMQVLLLLVGSMLLLTPTPSYSYSTNEEGTQRTEMFTIKSHKNTKKENKNDDDDDDDDNDVLMQQQ